MLCNICHKNEATVHFKGIFNNKVVKLSMCEDCAEKKGIKLATNSALAELISTLTKIDTSVTLKERKSVQCRSCQLTYSEFKKTGKLGCANCYQAFEYYLLPLISRIHGSSKYVGKKLYFSSEGLLKQRLKELKSNLNKLLENEQYEEAAKIRDRIKELKEKINSQ